MIYDCFTFNNELDLLEIRLNELSKVVDKFVLVESPITFSGLKKSLHFQNHKLRFKKFLPKIIHIVDKNIDRILDPTSLNYFPGYAFQRAHLESWAREINQRNSIKQGLTRCTPNDIILIGDVDEIPKATLISKLRPNTDLIVFEQNHYYYYFNCVAKEKWLGTRAVMYQDNIIPEQIRTSTDYKIQRNGGWHFSFLGGYKEIISKVRSYAHQEHNKSEYIEPNQLKYNIANALDIFHRPFSYQFVTVDNNYPQYLLAHQDKYSKYIVKNYAKDQNTTWLRNELFQARKKLYWQNIEVLNLNKAIQELQHKYHQALKYGPIYYLYKYFKK